jgi:hypothetical protein
MQEHSSKFADAFFPPTPGKRTPLRNEPRKLLKTIQSARRAQPRTPSSLRHSFLESNGRPLAGTSPAAETSHVGRVVNLRPIVNRPARDAPSNQ